MKMNWVEKAVVNNPVRVAMQRRLADGWLRDGRISLRDRTVLEIGCGQGAGTELLLERYGVRQVVAFDYDPTQLERARHRLVTRFGDRAILFVGDAERLPFADDRFDFVIEFGIMHHLPDWRRGLQEIARVLKPGGWFFYEEILKGVLAHPLTLMFFSHPRSGWFTAEEFYEALRGYGFIMTDVQRRMRQWWLAGMARNPIDVGFDVARG